MNEQPTIFVLEDEAPQLMVLKAALEPVGDVVTFTDPGAALAALRVRSVDAALVDIGLGRHASMDGLEFIRVLREFDRELAIIIRTGNATAELADQAIELGAFRRSIKTKQTVLELRDLTKAAIQETRKRRRITRDAATSAEVRVELSAALSTMDEELSAGDAYRVFLKTVRNRLTALAGMGELISREATTPLAREHAARNQRLVSDFVAEMNRFVEHPLIKPVIGTDRTSSTANRILDVVQERFAASAEAVKDGRRLEVIGLTDDLFVDVPALRLVAALRHIIEYCWERSVEGSSIRMSARFCEHMQKELDAFRESGLIYNLSSNTPTHTVAFRVVSELAGTSCAQLREAIEDCSENPRRGCLHNVGLFVDATRCVMVVHQRGNGKVSFDLHVPLAHT